MSERVPEGWEEIRLKELFKLNTKSVVPNDFPNEKFTYFSLPAFDEFGSSIEVQGNEIESNKFEINEDSILVSKLNPRKPRVMFAQPKELRACSSTEFMSYVPKNPSSVSLEYFTQYFLSNLFQRRLELVATGSTNSHVRVSPTETTRWKITVPPLPEQKTIASILTSVDEVIESTQKQIDKLQDLKKATMNELLTKGIGHTEFKDSELGRIPKSWEVSVVKNCIFDMTSGWSPDCLPDPAVGSQWGILKTTSVTWGGFDINENKALPAHLEGRAQISLKAGDVLVTRAGPIDRVGVVAFCKETSPKIMLSDKIIRIQTKSDELLGEFLSVWLGSYAAQKNMRSKISGMAEAQSNISQDILKSIPLPLPSLSEQKQIIQILRSLDCRIRAQRNKINQTQYLKKSLMQDLLTGKVRVQVD